MFGHLLVYAPQCGMIPLFVCLFVCFQKQSEDTVTYSTIMQLSGGEDQNSARPAGRPVDPNDLYATVQKNNNIQN